MNDTFYKLLKQCVPANIPVFLIKDKIFSQLSFVEIVKSTLEQILKSSLEQKRNSISYVECESYNFKSKGFLVEYLDQISQFQNDISKD